MHFSLRRMHCFFVTEFIHVMIISKKANTYIFWALQLIGWGFLTLVNIWAKAFIVPEDKVKPSYFFYEGTLFLIVAILLTTLYRNYLKRIKFVEDQSQKKYLKAFIGYAITVCVFSFLVLLGSDIGFEIINEEPLELSLLIIFSTTLNVGIFVFFWVVIYISVKLIARNQQNKIDRFRLETSLKESQLNTLKGQLNPHFMFNSLNNIRGLMLEDVDKARDMLTRLSEMLRYSLNMNKVDAIQIAEELETVDHYVALSKIQLEDRLQYEKQIDESLLQLKIPPMILQMLVENAIKHGVSNQKQGGKITVIITDNTEEIILQVNNTGTLQTDSDSTKIGIQNIEKRLELLYGKNASFTLQEVAGEVQATIKIPVE